MTAISRSKSIAEVCSSGFSIKSSGAADQDVDPSLSGHRIERRDDLFLGRDVHPTRAHPSARLRDRGHAGGKPILLRAVEDRDIGALDCECRRDRPADAAGAARHDGMTAFENAHQAMTSPRSTLTACPVMLRARSEARNR